MRVAVVGAGLGGLSAAARLIGRGHQVTIYEREYVPGGRAGVIREAGFALDNGPTVLTMPRLLSDTFEAAGKNMADYLTLERVDPMYRATFSDGSTIHVRHGREAMAAEIREVAGPVEAEGFDEFCNWVSELYRLEMPNFIDTNYDSFSDLIKPWRAAIGLVRMGAFGKLSRKVESFFDDDRLQRLFSFQSMYAGVAPHDALALFSIITYMDSIEGVFAPTGGMHSVGRALAKALVDAGCEIRYGHPISRILRGADNSVSGVEIAGSTRVDFDAVVCNADLPVAYSTLLGGVERPRLARRGEYSPSCLLWVAGVVGQPPAEAARHNLHFASQWKTALDDVSKRGVRMSDPSLFVSVAADPGTVPSGHSSLYALEVVPNLGGKIDWSKRRDDYAGDLRRRVGALGYNVDASIERVYDPLDWEAMGLQSGTPFSLAHTFRQSGPFRPNNVDRRVPGLVFVGANTVPGVGVPMVLISGKLAADRVEQFAKATATFRW
ncbi:MAG TPA: phytoene desaturase family protein [Ilumatobacter sp.]|nr:phytoene desaturase family protein [Ilumatobacter sp.]